MSADAKKDDLIYTTINGRQTVYIYSYASGKNVGQLSGFNDTGGLCSDAQGNVFVVDSGAEQIVEYPHGGTTSIETLSDSGNSPISCAVDPTTGNLAVTGGINNANVAIYRKGSSSPTIYSDSRALGFLWCTYDSSGNLFISPFLAYNYYGTIAELPAGGSSVINIFVNDKLNPGGGMQWDGKYIVVGNPAGRFKGPSNLEQVAVSGSTATIVGTIRLHSGKGNKDKNPGKGNEFWVSGNRVVDTTRHDLGIWHYPAGGLPLKLHYASVSLGLTVSVAP